MLLIDALTPGLLIGLPLGLVCLACDYLQARRTLLVTKARRGASRL